ncbi:MAG: 4'-phosphopantetheinyl transferase superfamily protein [Thermoanaerobaculia bacterium]
MQPLMASPVARPAIALPSGEVRLWWAATDRRPAMRGEAVEAVLSAAEIERMGRFAFPEDRRRYLVGRLLLRRSLSSVAPATPREWVFEAAAGGRPEVAAPRWAARLRFSLSRAPDVAVCALCLDHAVGVDVEALDAGRMGPAVERRILAAREREELAGLAGEARVRRLFALWTLKEAVLKALGTGLAVEPAEIAFSFEGGDGPAVTFEGPGVEAGERWSLESTLLPTGHALAIAVRRGAGEVVRFRPPSVRGLL